MTDARLLWDLGALLGEGPVWVERESALWFVDIKKGRVHRFDPMLPSGETFELGGMPSFVLPADDGSMVAGSVDRLLKLRGGGVEAELARIDMPGHNRTNDATVDREGRLWFGTMDNEEKQETGAVYRFDGREIRVMGGRCTITNGPAISPDGRHLYHVDTLGGTVTRFVLGGERLEGGEVIVTIDPADGHPDGVIVDAEGCLWLGLWGGWCARRYSPAGELLAQVRLPVANVTKVALGGPELKTAYVTTASIGLTDAERRAQPLAGGLFTFEVEVPGLPVPPVRLSA